MTDEEEFYAWLDGELDGDAAAAVAARVTADPTLTRLAARHRALGATLHGAFDPITSSPVPYQLLEAVRPRARVIDFGRRRGAYSARFGLPQWAAIAATLVVGVMTGTMLQGGSAAPVETRDGRLVAAAALDKALDAQLASASQSGPVRIGMTFRDGTGAICRSFTGTEVEGLACQDHGQWQIRGLFGAPESGQGDYRMAAGADPALAALIDLTIAGEAFGAQQERAAKEKGWR